MKLWNKKNDKETRRLPMGRKSKHAFAAYAAVVLMACCFITTAFAASDPLTVVNNLSDFWTDPRHRPYPARLRHCADRPFAEKP